MLDETAIILSALSIVGNICVGSFLYYKEKIKQQSNSAVEITTERSESNLAPIEVVVDNTASPSTSSSPSHVRVTTKLMFHDSKLLERTTQSMSAQNGGNKENGLEQLLGNALGINSNNSNNRNMRNSDASEENDLKVDKFLGFAENVLKASSPSTSPVISSSSSSKSVMTHSRKNTADASTNTFVLDDLESAFISHQEIVRKELVEIMGGGSDEFAEQYTDL